MQKILLSKNKARLRLCFVFFLSVSNLFSQNNSHIDSLKKVLEESPESCEKVVTLNKLARAHISIDVEKANEYSHKGILLSKAKNCKKELGDIYNTSSVIHFYNGNNQKAFLHVDSAIHIYTSIDYKKGLAAAIGNKGSFYNNIGSYSKALDLQYQCLRLNEEMGDKSAIATTLTNIFIVFHVQKDYKKALETGLEAYEIFDQLGDKDGVAIIGYNIALVYSEINQIDSSIYYLNQSEKLFSELNNSDGIADAYRCRGELLKKQNQFTKALSYVNKAMVLYDSIGQERKKIELYELISSLYYKMGKYEMSITKATDLLNEGRSQGVKQFEQDGAELLMQNYKAIGNYKKALKFSDLYHSLKNEILNETTLNEINRLKTEYDFERKELELESVTQQKQILKLELNRKNNTLIGVIILVLFISIITVFVIKQKRMVAHRKSIELNQKVFRTQMNPHFIFNALNSIQRIYVEGNIKKANNFMADFSQLMRKILENSRSNKITLSEEVETLRLYMDLEKLRSKEGFTYQIDIDESISLGMKIAPLLLQPFVENSIWHGVLPLENEKGQINIKITDLDEDAIQVEIKDNGVGFNPKDLMDNKNSRGIAITKQRIEGEVVIDSKPNVGTTVSFKIKKQDD